MTGGVSGVSSLVKVRPASMGTPSVSKKSTETNFLVAGVPCSPSSRGRSCREREFHGPPPGFTGSQSAAASALHPGYGPDPIQRPFPGRPQLLGIVIFEVRKLDPGGEQALDAEPWVHGLKALETPEQKARSDEEGHGEGHLGHHQQ